MRTQDISFWQGRYKYCVGDAKQLIIDNFKDLISDNSFLVADTVTNIINGKSISYLSKQPHHFLKDGC